MAAPASTVPVPSPPEDKVSFFSYVREVLSGTATLVQDAPLAVTAEAAGLMQEVPVVGLVCKTFLALEQLVDTARSNKEDLATLRDLCEVVIEGVLDKRSGSPGLLEKGFTRLEEHVKRAKGVAKLCNERVKQFLLARRICKDIAAVRNDVLAFCAANNLVLANDIHAKVDKLASDLVGKLEETKNLTVTQKDYEAMEKEVALKTKELEDMGKHVESKHILEAELRSSKEALTAIETKLEEQSRITAMVSKVKVPSAAPRIPHWYAERRAVVSEACNRLGIENSMANSCSEEPRMVGLAGPSGAGKSTVASMVIGREDVRASFHKGVLWLQVGQGAKDDLPELMVRLAGMVYETVLRKACRPLRKADLDNPPEDGAAYIREVVDESSRRFLVVADDVWEMEVFNELRRAGVWVLYTSRRHDLLPEPPLRLDQVLEEEAEMVLRRAAEVDDDTPLPEAAYELMRRCEFAVLDLAFVGRWGMARKRKSEMAWRTALERILKAQEEDEGGQRLSWRAAVLRAGLEELACDNTENKELYLALAVIPKGLAFPSEVSRVLLYGDGCSVEDLEAAKRVLENLERWSILTREGGGLYRVHDEHADYMQARFAASQDTRGRTMPRWRQYISSVRALVTHSNLWLQKSWDVLARVEGEDGTSRPFDAALGALDPSSADRPAALWTAAFFHKEREQWSEAYTLFVQQLAVDENLFGVDDLMLAFTLHNLGICATMVAKTEEAEQYWRRELAIRENKQGTDHLDVVNNLKNLGLCAHNSGRTEEAEKYFQRALAIQEDKLGAHHPDVAATLHHLGVCVELAGRTEEAEKYFQRALVIREDKLGADHPDVAATPHYLGLCADKAGRTEDAEEYSQGALVIRDKLGVDHPDVAATLHNLGVYAYKAGRTEEAEKYYQRALALWENKLGGDHPDVAQILHQLGVCIGKAGRTEEAEKCYQRALAILEDKLGADHPDLADTLHNLGLYVGKAGRTEEAEKYHQRALAIREEKLGADHPDVAITLYNLMLCADKSGRTEEAEKCYQRALAIREDKLGADHPDVATTLYNLGVCVDRAGRTGEAVQYYQRALAIREEKLGADHPDVGWTLHKLGVCARKLGRKGHAEENWRRALSILEDKLGVDDPSVVEMHQATCAIGKVKVMPISKVAVVLAGVLLCVAVYTQMGRKGRL